MNSFQVNGHTNKRKREIKKEREKRLAHKIPTNANSNDLGNPCKEKRT